MILPVFITSMSSCFPGLWNRMKSDQSQTLDRPGVCNPENGSSL
jgi:hypothetical protein